MTARRFLGFISLLALTMVIYYAYIDIRAGKSHSNIVENLTYTQASALFAIFLMTSGYAKFKMLLYDKPTYIFSSVGIITLATVIFLAHSVTLTAPSEPLELSRLFTLAFFLASWILSDILNIILPVTPAQLTDTKV